MRLQGLGKALKTPAWQADEMFVASDAALIGMLQYQNFVDLVAMLVEAGRSTGSTPNKVLSGLILEWNTGMQCNLRAGLAVSFQGSYYNSLDVFGWNASPGDCFAVEVGVDTPVTFANGSPSNPRIDVLEIKPVINPYMSTSRFFMNPLTQQQSLNSIPTRNEFGFTFNIVQGTPAGSPVAPATDAGWIKIAEVLIPANASAINQTNITDFRNSAAWTNNIGSTAYALIHSFELDFGTGTNQISAGNIPIVDSGGFYPTKNVEAALQTAGSVLKESYTPTSGYTPAVGDVVELNYDGTIRKAKRVNTLSLASGSVVVAARCCPVDATHVLVVYAVGLVIYAQVFSVSIFDLSMTAIGSPATVFTCTTTLANFDVAYVSASLALVAYHTTGGSYTSTSAVTLSISGGYAVTVNSPVASGSNGQCVSLHTIPSTTNIMAAWLTAATTITASIISISGTVPTFNSTATQTITSAWVSAYPIRIGLGVSLAGDAAYVSTSASASPFDCSICAFLISGTTLTACTNVVDTGYPGGQGSLCPGAIDEIAANNIVLLQQASVAAGAQVANSFVFLTPRRRSNTSTGFFSTSTGIGWPVSVMPTSAVQQDGILLPIDLNGCGLTVAASVLQNGNYGVSIVFFRKARGSVVEAFQFGDEYVYNGGASGANNIGLKACVLSSGIVVCAVGINATSAASALVAMRRRNQILGIAIDTAGTVQRTGICTLSGLTPGVQYGVDDNGNLTTSLGEAKIGQAISATKLALQVVPGI